jgi:hypothetical protein
MRSRLVRHASLPLSSLLVLALAAGSVSAAPPTPAAPARTVRTSARHATTRDSLAAQAKISEAAARATALSKVPGGRVKAHELERENGLLIHSFDIAVAGRPGIDEVIVNALDGSIVSVKHEDQAAERLEAKQDRAEKAAAHAVRKSAKTKPAVRDSAKTH